MVHQISELLAEVDTTWEADAQPSMVPVAVPEDTPSGEWLRRGPPANHRNAIICPQCDKWTWMASELCWNCDLDVRAMLDELEAEEQARLQAQAEAVMCQEQREWDQFAAVIALVGIACLFGAPLVSSGPLSGALFISGGTALVIAWFIHKLFG